MNDVKYDVNDMQKPGLLVGFIFQHLFTMFRATVLVPFWLGLILLCSHLVWGPWLMTVTKYKIPLLTWGLVCLYCCYADVDED